jgi:hypothetical protein
MAIDIKFEGFVNGIRSFEWGTVYDVAHNQMLKDEQGEWKVDGKDYFSVTGPAGFEEGDKVSVVGRLKTKLFDKKDGSKGVSLNVRATEMVKVERRGGQSNQVSGQQALAEVFGDTLKGIDEQAPF